MTFLQQLREHLDEAFMNTPTCQRRARSELEAATLIACRLQHEAGEIPARCDCQRLTTPPVPDEPNHPDPSSIT